MVSETQLREKLRASFATDLEQIWNNLAGLPVF